MKGRHPRARHQRRAIRQHECGTRRQGHADLRDGGVEACGGELEEPVVLPHAEVPAHAVDGRSDGPVLDLHPLGTPRRARGVDDVGKVLSPGRSGVCATERSKVVDRDRPESVRQVRRVVGVAAQHLLHPGILDHVAQPLGRMTRVERQPRIPGQHQPVHGRHAVVGLGRCDGSEPPGSQVGLRKRSRQPLNTIGELAVGQATPGPDERRAAGITLRSFEQGFMQKSGHGEPQLVVRSG